MLAPVLLFAFAGLAVGIAIIAQNGDLIPLAADKESAWNHFWSVWEAGAWTVFNQMELLFVIGLPIALAKTANARAVMEAAMVYLTFNYFVGTMLKVWGKGGTGFFDLDYTTARPEKRKEVLALLIPVSLTAILIGITEPLEFTFLFLAPPLFLVHAILAASMAAIMYQLGLVGYMGGGLLDFLFQNWIPLWANHSGTYLMQIGVGLCFTVLYFVIFRFMILKFDFKTPGREEDGGETKLYSKAEYKAAKAAEKDGGAAAESADGDLYAPRAAGFLELLGGAENITTVNNCATRLRVSVADESLVSPSDADFKSAGALGLVRKGKAFQVIVGMDVPQVRERFETMVNEAKTLS